MLLSYHFYIFLATIYIISIWTNLLTQCQRPVPVSIVFGFLGENFMEPEWSENLRGFFMEYI